MHGVGGSPAHVEDTFKAADNVRYYLNGALAIRLARIEGQQKFELQRDRVRIKKPCRTH
jgi:hypothetical protein